MKNSFMFRKKAFYPIGAVYLIYLLIYLFQGTYGLGYSVINNFERIAYYLWMTIGVLAVLVICYSLWQRKNNYIDNKSTAKYIIWALILFFMFNAYTMTISFIDFALFGFH